MTRCSNWILVLARTFTRVNQTQFFIADWPSEEHPVYLSRRRATVHDTTPPKYTQVTTCPLPNQTADQTSPGRWLQPKGSIQWSDDMAKGVLSRKRLQGINWLTDLKTLFYLRRSVQQSLQLKVVVVKRQLCMDTVYGIAKIHHFYGRQVLFCNDKNENKNCAAWNESARNFCQLKAK